MNMKTKDTKRLNPEVLEKVNGGTEFDAYIFVKHLSKKYGVKTLTDIKKHWTQEEHDYFNIAYNRKEGDEPLGPYPD